MTSFVVRRARGWVLVQAAGPGGLWGWIPITGPDGGASISASAADCPKGPYTLDGIANLSPEARLACFGDETISIDAGATRRGSLESWAFNDPDWLLHPGYYCRYATDPDGPWLDVAFAPASGLDCDEEPAAGHAYRITGHFDDPAAATCRSWEEDPTTGEKRYDAKIQDVFHCRTQFVVTAREVVDLR